MTRCVVQKPLPSVARPALLRHIGPQASNKKWPGLPRPLPLGEVSAKQTERASPARKSRCEAIGRLFCQSDTIAVQELFGSVLALSGASRQFPQRGSHWHVGQLSSGRAKHNISETVVLRCLGQRQLDKERCPEVAALCSEARPFAPYRAFSGQAKVARPAKASPSGRGVCEADGEGKPGTKEPL